MVNSINTSTTTPTIPAESPVLISRSVESIGIELGGNPEAYVAAMVLKFANERSASAREQRDQLEKNITQKQDEQVKQLRAQADDLRKGAWASAAGSILSGGLQLASSGMNLDALSDKSTALENLGANPSAVDLAEVDSGYASAVAHANRWGAGAPLATAGGTLGQSYFDHDAKNDEASSVAAEHRADHQIRALDQIKDDIDDANELEDKAYDFLDQVSETRADTDQAVFIRG